MNTLRSKECQQKLRVVSCIAAALLITSLSLNAQAAELRQEINEGLYNMRRTARELRYQVEMGCINMAHTIKTSTKKAAHTISQGARDVGHEINREGKKIVNAIEKKWRDD
jgi:hypothetical protein